MTKFKSTGTNFVASGDGFYISYNSSPLLGTGGAETAIRNKTTDEFDILYGDFREVFEPLIEKGYFRCMAEFTELVKKGAKISEWSDGKLSYKLDNKIDEKFLNNINYE